MCRKIVVVFCLLLFAGAVLGSQQSVFAKDQKPTTQQQSKQKQSNQKQDTHKQSFKQKCEQKVKQIKTKVNQRFQIRTPSAVAGVRG
jgi:preprotein translocase subunit SecF